MNAIIEHEQDDLIIRYLRGQLAGGDKAQFEIRTLDEPELLERVQLLEALQQELGEKEGMLLEPDASTPRATVLPFSAWLRQPLSLAASVLVAALGLNALVGSRTPDTADVMPVDTLVLLDARRDTTVPTFDGSGPYLLQIDAGIGTETAVMKLTLRDTSGAALVEQNMKVGSDGWVRLLYTNRLNGAYRIELDWTDSTGTARMLSYSFNVQDP